MKSIEAIKATINKGQERINKLTAENHENDFSLEIAKAALDMAKNEFILAVTQGISINRLEEICNAERVETLTHRKLDDLQKDIITALIEQQQRKG